MSDTKYIDIIEGFIGSSEVKVMANIIKNSPTDSNIDTALRYAYASAYQDALEYKKNELKSHIADPSLPATPLEVLPVIGQN